MANVLYPKYKESLLAALLAGSVKVALIDTAAYTYSAAHEFYSSVSGVVGTPVALTSKTGTSGVFDAANPTFTAVTGPTAEAIIVYLDTGVAGTSPVLAYFDTGVTNLPVTPNGGDIVLTFNASGIFAL